MSAILTAGILCIFIVLRFLLIVPWKRRTPSRSNKKPRKSLIILGSGGHTAEMFRLLRGLDTTFYNPRIYVKAVCDNISSSHCEDFEKRHENGNSKYSITSIPRARQVGQSYLSSFFTTWRSLFYCLFVVVKYNPDLILCNGPGTCVPICLAAYLLRFFGKRVDIIYVESICRVKDLSLSGKLLYFFADKMYVQWPELTKKFPKTEYLGLLCQ